MNSSTNFHHALPTVLSDSSTDCSTTLGDDQSNKPSDVDRWVADLKEIYFNDINSLPTKTVSQASSQPIENTE